MTAPDDARTTARGAPADRPLDLTPLTAGPVRVGPYRVVRPLGEGGMGIVYLAEQDEPVRREVALKVLRSGSDSAEVVARFQSERQALALMEHPNITRVYDAGTTDAGLPYFVMERVTGVPITEYADAHRLDVRARVRLFTQVCHAVQHAHQKGIIHRDIKPSNVLVTEADGAPLCKVIDFGIAKAVIPAADAERLTATGLAIGTPLYMSPEQFVGAGADVDTRADIYSLGVLLYELLAGVLPLDTSAEPLGAWALAALHVTTDAPAPSARYGALGEPLRAALARERDTDPAALRRALEGDLDAVLLKALEHDRERRYATANDLARDLEHYLHDQPVTATPPSPTYRMRKFVRRHRMSVTFVTTLLVLLVAFTAAVTVQAAQLARARRVAVARQGQAEELVGFMLGDLRGRLTPIGKLDVLDAVGQKALAYFAAVPEAELSDGEVYRRAEALQQLGQVRMDQGKLPEAGTLFRQAIALDARLTARDSTNGAWQIGLGHAHFWAGKVEWQRGSTDSALAHFVPFVRISERLIRMYPDTAVYRRELAYALSNIGSAREAQGDLRGALQSYGASLELRRQLLRRDSTDPGLQGDLALTYNTVGFALRKAGDLRGALASHQAELALRRTLLARDTSDRGVLQRDVAVAHSFVGNLRLLMGDAVGAASDARAARAIYTVLVERDTANALWRLLRAVTGRTLAHALLEQGAAAAALTELDASRALLTGLLAGNSGDQRAAGEFVLVETLRARSLLLAGRADEARPPAQRALAAAESALAATPRDVERRRRAAEASLAVGDVRQRAGDGAGARAAWLHALTLVDSAARATQQVDLLALAATALLDLGRVDEARPKVVALVARGYRRPGLVALARRNGIVPSS